jgi:hypothetical protein
MRSLIPCYMGWLSMHSADFVSRVILGSCCVLCFCLSGCGGGAAATTAGFGTEQERLDTHIKTLGEPLPEDPQDARAITTKQLGACGLLKGMGPRAKSAIPALEKVRDETPNEDVKKAAVDALAAIQK